MYLKHGRVSHADSSSSVSSLSVLLLVVRLVGGQPQQGLDPGVDGLQDTGNSPVPASLSVMLGARRQMHWEQARYTMKPSPISPISRKASPKNIKLLVNGGWPTKTLRHDTCRLYRKCSTSKSVRSRRGLPPHLVTMSFIFQSSVMGQFLRKTAPVPPPP